MVSGHSPAATYMLPRLLVSCDNCPLVPQPLNAQMGGQPCRSNRMLPTMHPPALRRRLFLNVDAKRQGKEAEYARLCAEVEQLEALAASNSAAAAPAIPPLPGAAKVAAAAATQGGPYSLVADGTAAAAAAVAARLHRIDVFQVTALDESPEVTPAKQPSSSKCGKEAGGEEGAPGTAAGAQVVATPASTLLTPQAYSTASSSSCVGGSGGLPTAATPHTSGSVACAGADAECATGSSMHSGGVAGVAGSSPSSIARTAERWRQGEILSQIDKDLVGAGAAVGPARSGHWLHAGGCVGSGVLPVPTWRCIIVLANWQSDTCKAQLVG